MNQLFRYAINSEGSVYVHFSIPLIINLEQKTGDFPVRILLWKMLVCVFIC